VVGGRTEERLLRHLFGGEFDVDARGVNGTNSTVTVRIQLLLLRIQGLVSTGQYWSVGRSCRGFASPAPFFGNSNRACSRRKAV